MNYQSCGDNEKTLSQLYGRLQMGPNRSCSFRGETPIQKKEDWQHGEGEQSLQV